MRTALLVLLSALAVAGAQTAMNSPERRAATAAELAAANMNPGVTDIIVTESLAALPTLRLAPGKNLRAASAGTTLRFAAGQDGVQLTSDNRVENLELQ